MSVVQSGSFWDGNSHKENKSWPFQAKNESRFTPMLTKFIKIRSPPNVLVVTIGLVVITNADSG